MKHSYNTCRTLCLSLLILGTVDVARADNAGEAPKATPGCTIFLGGIGSRSGNKDFNQRWITVNKAVSNAAIGKLTELHYRIEPFFSEASTSQEAFADFYPVMQRKQCDQVIELSHELSLPKKTGAVPHLEFKVTVFHLESDGTHKAAKVIGEYEHSYPFDLTQEVMDHLSLEGVGTTVATDVDAAHVVKARGP